MAASGADRLSFAGKYLLPPEGKTVGGTRYFLSIREKNNNFPISPELFYEVSLWKNVTV